MVSESVFGGASKRRRKGFTDKKSKHVVPLDPNPGFATGDDTKGRWDVNMLADYCWMLRRETEDDLCYALWCAEIKLPKEYLEPIQEKHHTGIP
ncbi:hypothetical protein AVEN_175520-1 [Araneus ventricosus]|uniref:Uncharacterized protein n=1 Tax=Araneus ventricosus TaxID=182803 RepID=A0A4Y2CML2_ARAVE|nr:hypothetical protein AVEN_175520-1 [Araneus ventricosus]